MDLSSLSNVAKLMSSIILEMDRVSILVHTRYVRGNKSVITGKFSQISRPFAG